MVMIGTNQKQMEQNGLCWTPMDIYGRDLTHLDTPELEVNWHQSSTINSAGVKGVPVWQHEDMMAEQLPQTTGEELDTDKSIDEFPAEGNVIHIGI